MGRVISIVEINDLKYLFIAVFILTSPETGRGNASVCFPV